MLFLSQTRLLSYSLGQWGNQQGFDQTANLYDLNNDVQEEHAVEETLSTILWRKSDEERKNFTDVGATICIIQQASVWLDLIQSFELKLEES
jgi:hypothetical protein